MRYNCFGYSVISIGFWAQEAVCNQVIDIGTGFMKVLYLGRAPRTKETLPDFREKCRVTRHSRVFRGLTGSQRTPGFWGVTLIALKNSSDSLHKVRTATVPTLRTMDKNSRLYMSIGIRVSHSKL